MTEPETWSSSNRLSGQQIGRYLVQEQIGSGGVATVYRAFDQVNQSTVAFKVLAPTADQVTLSRFRNEALTAGQLRHPNIVPIYQVGATADSHVPYIAMAMIDGENLADRLARTGRLPPADGCILLEPIARALAFAHRAGIVHRDVKPSNILLQKVDDTTVGSLNSASLDGPVVPLLSDFGIARALDAPELTGIGQTVGTPAYMAPEQASGHRDIDGRADIYALGAVLYRTVVGHLPFSGSASQILHAHVYAPLTIEDDLLEQLPSSVIDILTRTLAKKPEERYPDADTLADALALASGLPTAFSSASQAPALDAATATMAALPSAPPGPKPVHVLVPAVGEQPVIHSTQRPASLNRRWMLALVAVALITLLIGGAMALSSLMDRVADNGVEPAVVPMAAGPVTATTTSVEPVQAVGDGDGGVALVLVTATPMLISPDAPTESIAPTLSAESEEPAPTPVSATATPLSPASPTPVPTVATPTPLPVIDETVVVEISVPDQQEIFTCANVVEPSLASYIEGIDPRIADGFRCPNSGAAYTNGQILRFEQGFMLDLANDPSIYIYYDINQEWERAVSSWREGDPAQTGDVVPPAPNLYQPQDAFGQLWTDPQRQVALGFATVEGPVDFAAIEQTFANGALVRNVDDGAVWLFLREKLRL